MQSEQRRGELAAAFDPPRADDDLPGEQYHRLFIESRDGICLADAHSGEILDCNPAFERLVGFRKRELTGRPECMLYRIEPGAPQFSRPFAAHRLAEQSELIRAQVFSKAGQVRDVEILGSASQCGGRRVVQQFFRDVTDDCREQRDGEASLALVRLFLDGSHPRELARRVTELLQQWSGCEAAGIRLRHGKDCFYCETRGFPPEFVDCPTTPCRGWAGGELDRTSDRRSPTKCLGCDVLNDRVAFRLPCFTANGSLCANRLSELAAAAPEEGLLGELHRWCATESLQSLTFVPVRHGEDVLGYLQLYDRQPDRFTPATMAFLESAGVQIGLALAQRRAVAALAASEQRFKDITEAASEFLWEIDAGGRIQFISDRVTEILGYRSAELLGRSALDLLAAEERLSGLRVFAARRRGRRDFREQEVALGTASGERVWLSCSGVPLCDADGQPQGYRGAASNVTARRLEEQRREREEEQLRQTQAELAHMARLTTVGEMTAGIAHEINKPLYSILNYAKACGNVLSQRRPSLADLREWNQGIAAAAARAGAIMKRLMEFLRKAEPQLLPESVWKIVDEAIQLVALEPSSLDVILENQCSPRVPFVRVDRVQIQQVLFNLLCNACDALHRNGIDERRIVIRSATGAEFVEVSVSDTGPGLGAIDAEQLFAPFFTTKTEGLGMGLAICKTIVEAHGGRISASSSEGGGAVFRFTLPLG